MRERARLMWQLFEPYHAVVYFERDAKRIYEAVGLKGGWMGYFASRAAPLGPVPAEVVTALFFNFHPEMVRRAIPDAWRRASPEEILAARLVVADGALRRLLGSEIGSPDVDTAAGLVRRIAEACVVGGRPLYAAHASLPWPHEPHLALWHGATLLREHRGDGHVVSLMVEMIDGCQANVITAATGALPAAQRTFRGWSDEEWEAAAARLKTRGLLDDESGLTHAGMAVRREVEERTDRLAAPPFVVLDDADAAELMRIMARFGRLIVKGEGVPFPNPMGVTRPAMNPTELFEAQ